MYKNFGDVNFFENGLLIEKDAANNTGYYVIACDPICDEDEKWLFRQCYVDVSDDWIDRDSVIKFNGYTSNSDEIIRGYEKEPEWYVMDILSYYGTHEFSIDYTDGLILTANEVMQELENIDIANDVIFDPYI